MQRFGATFTSPLFVLVAIIAVVAALYVAKAILLPFALAVLLTFLLTPLANRFELWGLPRIAATIVVVAMVFAVLGILGWVVYEQVMALGREMAGYRDEIVAKVRDVTDRVQAFGEPFTGRPDGDPATDAEANDAGLPTQNGRQDALRDGIVRHEAARPLEERPPPARAPPDPDNDAVEVKVVAMPPSPLTQIRDWLGPVVGPVTSAGIVVLLTFFMLLDRENQRDRIIQLFGTRNLHATTGALQDATRRVARFLRMMFFMNAGYGVAVIIGLSLLGVPGAVMWGVLGFALRFLPYLGPWLAAGMPILVSIAVADGWTQPLLVAGMYLVYETLLNNVAEPLLYGSSIGVSTVGVIVVAVFWTWLWGPIGLIVAMPMTVCLVVLARHVPQLRFITVLLADQPPLTPAERIYQRLLAFDYNEPLKLAQRYLKTAPLVTFYDEVLIPALVLAERDRHAGLLGEEEAAFVQEAADDLVQELAHSEVEVSAPKGGPAESDGTAIGSGTLDASIICLPLRDEADEIAARMLEQLLSAVGFRVETGGAAALASEMVGRVAETESDIVVISILPPIRPRESRLLWKRLRQRYPKLPIIVGFWSGASEPSAFAQPEPEAGGKLVTTLGEAVALARQTAAQVQLEKAV